MKKRNTEGFALAYVVVVITVLCTLAIGLMSISLRILQVQDKNMQRMKDKYEAQGQVELFVAEFSHDSSGLTSLESPTVIAKEQTVKHYESAEAALNAEDAATAIAEAHTYAAADIEGYLLAGEIDSTIVPDSGDFRYKDDDVFYFCEVACEVAADDSSTVVQTTIRVECEIKTAVIPVKIEYEDATGQDQYEDRFMYGYTIVSADSEFTSYEILSDNTSGKGGST